MVDPNILWIVSGCLFLGICGGLLGCFAYLRKQSLLGDVLSHAAFPGVCLAFLVTGTKSIGAFLIGALACGALAMLAMSALTRWTRIKADSAMAITVSASFAMGIVLLTQIQQTGNPNQAGLDRFLFGQASALGARDVTMMMVLTGVVLFVLSLCYVPLKAMTFDPQWAKTRGYRIALLEVVLIGLFVLTIVAGIQAVGVLMMAALFITPAVMSRYWTSRFGWMLSAGAAFGGVGGAIGAWLSATAPQLPTGPLVVIVLTGCFVLTFFVAPKQGILALSWVRLRQRRQRREHTPR